MPHFMVVFANYVLFCYNFYLIKRKAHAQQKYTRADIGF